MGAKIKAETKVSFTKKGKKVTGTVIREITFRKKQYFYISLKDGSKVYKRTNAVEAK